MTEDKLKEVIDVRDFGAKGNGLADDREAFKNAIDYAVTCGKPVHVSPGLYRMFRSPWWYRLWKWIGRPRRLSIRDVSTTANRKEKG